MEKKEAEKYPLFKDYEFGIDLTSPRGGMGTLLIPNKRIYVPKQFGFGALSLAPYIQEIFNKESKIAVQDLVKELEEENEIILSSIPLSDEEWFLEKVIKRFSKHGIINLEKMVEERDLSKYDILAKGVNYNRVRVYNMTSNKGESDVSLNVHLNGNQFPNFGFREN